MDTGTEEELGAVIQGALGVAISPAAAGEVTAGVVANVENDPTASDLSSVVEDEVGGALGVATTQAAAKAAPNALTSLSSISSFFSSLIPSESTLITFAVILFLLLLLAGKLEDL